MAVADRMAPCPTGPAVLFADQSKAFERVPHAWLLRVLDAWGLPPWARAVAGAFLKCGEANRLAKRQAKLSERNDYLD